LQENKGEENDNDMVQIIFTSSGLGILLGTIIRKHRRVGRFFAGMGIGIIII
jgi:hypothetical protein